MIAWDCFFDETGKAKGVVARMQEIVSGRARVVEVHEANFLLVGQSTSRSGSILGVRLMLECYGDDLEGLSKIIQSSTVEGSTDNFTLWSVDCLSELNLAPLPMYHAEELGERGVFTLNVEFSDGWGATTAKNVKNARDNQAKDTKNTLDLCKEKYNCTDANPFMRNKMLSRAVTEPGWFLIKKLEEGGLPRKSSGGSYQFSYSLEEVINRLVEASQGTWWSPMSVGESVLRIDCSEELNVPENPLNWFHKKDPLFAAGIDSAVVIENRRSKDAGLIDDMQYMHESIVSSEPPKMSLGRENGAFPGDEDSVVRQVLRDWVVMEFFHLMHSFLMVRNPQSWMNGRSEIRVFSGSLQ